MKLGVFTVLLSAKSLEESLAYLKESGVQAVELRSRRISGQSSCESRRTFGGQFCNF